MADVDLTNNPFVPPEGHRCIINELPSELLSHIFTLGWTPERDQEPSDDIFEDEEGSDEDSYSSTSSLSDDNSHRTQEREDDKIRKLPFNVLVSHVCAQWRAVALANPLLWNHISFVGPPPFERALTYLERAGTAPLAITVDRTVEDDEDEDEDEDSWSESDYPQDNGPDRDHEPKAKDNDSDLEIMTGIMNLIIPRIEHVEALQIMVSLYPHMHRALEMLGALPGAPMLEVLQLYHYEDTDEHEAFKWPELRKQSFRLFSGNIPRLTQVALWGVHLDWSEDGCPFLSGLTDLELAYHARDVRPSFKDFVRILRSSPDLRTLTLCLSCPAGTPNDWPRDGMTSDDGQVDDGEQSATSGHPLVMSKLQELVLAYIEPSYLLDLMPRFSFPALTSLAMDLEEDDYSDFLSYLSSPRSLPQPPLPPLALRGPGVAGPPSAQRARSLLSNLTSLKVASLPCTDALVRDAYRQLEQLTALNLNLFYLRDVWFDLLHPHDPDGGAAGGAGGAGAGAGGAIGTRAPDVHADPNELLLPRLESLTTTGVDGDRMRELVRVRAARGAPLKVLRMNEEDDVESEDEAWLTENVDRFEFFEGSDEEEIVGEELDDIPGAFGSDDEDGWEDEGDEDEDEDGFDDGPDIVIDIL